MKIASSMPSMPRIYIIDDESPNAFAAGRKPENSVVAVTAGLLKKLNRDELQGVIAHEMAHIQNRDILFVTLAGVMMGSIVLLSDIFLRSVFYTGGGRRRSGGRGGGQGAAIFMIIAIVLAIVGPIVARLLYFALSRRREYLADANGALFTRYPEGLASALEKISGDTAALSTANRVTAPLYIINPLHKAGVRASNLTSTHPPIDKRVNILRGMGNSASLIAYNKAFKKAMGKSGDVIPASGLRSTKSVPVRQASPEAKKPESKRKKVQGINDLVEKVNQYAFLACLCGLRMKIPPEMKEKKVKCPRCGRANELPVAELAAIGVLAKSLGDKEKKKQEENAATAGDKGALQYRRKGSGWNSFQCACKQTITLSPAFSAKRTRCPKCKRTIEIA
jgi:heat shock protein HtpX